MKRLAVASHVAPSKVFPHNLRRLFATVFYDKCHDIARLADVLGHSSIETTRIYLITPSSVCRQQIESLHLVEWRRTTLTFCWTTLMQVRSEYIFLYKNQIGRQI